MTTIDKIAICGIRSYDPNGLVVIKFFKPLTIILGNNGCGKTTIIEALKYVCTGETPPLSGKGRTFVHDPNHCGVNVVKAQVKVAFKTRDNKPVIVNSSMQLTQKRTKTEFKTIDGVVRMYDESTNEQIALSHKCADMKKVVPELMGVSRAILDNVIFCHQSDADWPLSEPKKLKEKFDEIFATSRWSKALVNITQYKKTLASRSKDLKTDLKVFENNKEIALKLTNDLQQTKIRMAQYKDRSRKYLAKIKDLKASLVPLNAAKNKLVGFDGRKRVLENDINHLRTQQKNAHNRMSCEYDEGDSELEEFLSNHNTKIKERQKELSVVTVEYERLKRELGQKQYKLKDLHAKRGKIEQILEDNRSKKSGLEQKIRSLKERYSLSDGVTEETIVSELQSGERNKKREFESFKRNVFDSDKTMESAINECVAKKNKFEFTQNEIQRRQRDMNSKRRTFAQKLNKINSQLQGCDNIGSQIQKLEREIGKYNNDSISAWEQQITDCGNAINRNNSTMKELNIERKSLQTQSEQTAKLQFKKEQFRKANANYNRLYESIKDKLCNVLGTNISKLEAIMNVNQGLTREFGNKYKHLQSEYESNNKKYNKLQTGQSVFESQLMSVSTEKDKVSQSLSANIIELSSKNLSLDTNITEIIAKQSKVAQDKQADLALSKCGRTLYSKFNNLAKKKNHCPVCQRHFANNSELNTFVKTNTNRIKNVEKSGAIEKHESDVRKAQKKLQILQSLLPIYQNALKQQNELKNLERKLAEMNIKNKKSENELQEMFTRKIESKSMFDKCNILSANVNDLQRQFESLKMIKRELKTEESKLAKLSKNKRNLQNVQSEYDSLLNENNSNNALQQKLRMKINEFDRKKRAIQNRLISLKQRQSNFEKLNTEKERITNESNALDSERDNIQTELGTVNSEIEPIIKEIKDKKRLRLEQRKKSQSKERNLSEIFRKYTTDINSLQNEIKRYKQSCLNVDKYSQLSETLKSEEMSFKTVQSAYTQCESTKYEIDKWLDNVHNDKQDLQSNLEFRKFKRLVKAKRLELSTLTTEMNEIHSNSANIDEEIEEAQTKIAIEQSNYDQNKGATNSEKLKAVEFMDTLRTDRYKDISEKHRQQLIKYETTVIASKDLDKFEKALDRSLIEFHGLKMKEINSVLKELWQQTYRGKDIDFIEIKSEVGSATNKKRKSYNYNVIMRQGDASLTMRGRCSAGQRVLAALLIRLALAETFCINCGVLALDEPTTNLDSKNIAALAYALNQIITRRKRQENFQLILITHDEAFVEKLGQREHTDGYYRVFKDDLQHSRAKLYKFDAGHF